MTVRGHRWGWVLLLAVACGKGSSPPPPAASASSRASSAPPSPPPSPHDVAPLPPAAAPSCRALRVLGQARVGDDRTPLVSGALVDGSDWIELADNAKLTLKHSTSGRELSVSGPALFRACGRGREQLLLARGRVLTTAGMGARPGAEVMIATPLLAAHYGDAELELQLDGKELRLQARAGRVELEAPPGAKKAPDSPLPAKRLVRLPFAKPDPAAVVGACQKAAEQAHTAALRVTDSQSKEPLGERARAHVRARQAARASCLVAGAATGLVADTAQRAGLWAEVVRGEALLESIPRRGSAQAPEK